MWMFGWRDMSRQGFGDVIRTSMFVFRGVRRLIIQNRRLRPIIATTVLLVLMTFEIIMHSFKGWFLCGLVSPRVSRARRRMRRRRVATAILLITQVTQTSNMVYYVCIQPFSGHEQLHNTYLYNILSFQGAPASSSCLRHDRCILV